jgi:hypothetical protein
MVAGDNPFSISRLNEVVNDSQGEGTSVKGDGELPDHPSCSQNAHDKTMLVPFAQ